MTAAARIGDAGVAYGAPSPPPSARAARRAHRTIFAALLAIEAAAGIRALQYYHRNPRG